MIFLATIVARAREAMGTPSDCTAPSTSHNRGPSTAYRCRRKIAFRRCLVVINRPIWPLCHKFCFVGDAPPRSVRRDGLRRGRVHGARRGVSRDLARKHQKYHESGPARPATGGAQNGDDLSLAFDDFVVIKRERCGTKMARTGRRELGSARHCRRPTPPQQRCVRVR